VSAPLRFDVAPIAATHTFTWAHVGADKGRTARGCVGSAMLVGIAPHMRTSLLALGETKDRELRVRHPALTLPSPLLLLRASSDNTLAMRCAAAQ
jgi:hypothetical protein